MKEDFDEEKKKKRKPEDFRDDDIPKGTMDDFINLLAENMKEIIPELEKIFTEFQDQFGKGNFNLENLKDYPVFKIPEGFTPQNSKATTISKSYPSEDVLVDVIDCNNEIIVIIELPTLEKEDIKLSLKDNDLLITVNKTKISKKIPLPAKINENKVSASYKNGILEIKLGKI